METSLPQRVAENAPGDFYVERDVCLRCCIPHTVAPELLDDPEEGAPSCYFRRQPQTEAEIDHAIQAISISCVHALRYGGNDPTILARIQKVDGRSSCDALPPLPRRSWWRRLFGGAG